ncbi:MAG: blaR [Clostridia bacterium]|jgi:bla regulator protein BlaR1|nr:blaR [Clostridia bacterium]
MKQSENEINSVIKGALGKAAPGTSFEALWDMYSSKSQVRAKFKRAAMIPLIAVFTLFACFTIGYAGLSRMTDNTDLPFVDDPAVIGKWEAVDFVADIEDFDPDRLASDDLYLRSLVFIKEGRMLNRSEGGILSNAPTTWTKGTIINDISKTASKYQIKDMNDGKYMFVEWKSGDYIFRLLKPDYYVLRQVDSEDYSGYEVQRKEDEIDYPFVDNPEMIGRWVSVDFVEDIDSFDPEKQSYQEELSLKELRLLKNGKVKSENLYGDVLDSTLSWTGDLIISQKRVTASKCIIKEINSETYMFFEWKSGDYTYRGMQPQYYVLKKLE